jgi:hypothetical protein
LKYTWREAVAAPLIWCAGRLINTRAWKWLWKITDFRK